MMIIDQDTCKSESDISGIREYNSHERWEMIEMGGGRGKSSPMHDAGLANRDKPCEHHDKVLSLPEMYCAFQNRHMGAQGNHTFADVQVQGWRALCSLCHFALWCLR